MSGSGFTTTDDLLLLQTYPNKIFPWSFFIFWTFFLIKFDNLFSMKYFWNTHCLTLPTANSPLFDYVGKWHYNHSKPTRTPDSLLDTPNCWQPFIQLCREVALQQQMTYSHFRLIPIEFSLSLVLFLLIFLNFSYFSVLWLWTFLVITIFIQTIIYDLSSLSPFYIKLFPFLNRITILWKSLAIT